jgi:hypothetical protein
MMEIAKLFNRANIPSILWGNSLLDIYCIPTGEMYVSNLASAIGK